MREFGSEYSFASNADDYFKSLEQESVDYAYLRCGRDALGFVADCISDNGGIILLPAYCCDSMISPFRSRNWTVYFYSLNSNLTINSESLHSLCNDHSPNAILVMNYFGMTPIHANIYNIKSQYPDVNIIEDFTHILFDYSLYRNSNVDFYVASIRKWIGILDGAIVLSSMKLMKKPSFVETEFIKYRYSGLTLKLKYSFVNDESLKNQYRSLLKSAEDSLSFDYHYVAVSPLGKMQIQSSNSNQISMARLHNFHNLYKVLSSNKHITLIGNADVFLGRSPFSLPILVSNRDAIQVSLALKGVFTQVLWPIDKEAESVCHTSKLFTQCMLSIPIDQRYDKDDIFEMGEIITRTLNETN